MRVAISDDSAHNSTAWSFIRRGWARAFDLSDNQVFVWKCNEKPALDLFDERKFDIFFGQSYNLNRGLVKALIENPECKVVLQAGDWSEWSNKIDSNKYPILKASKEEIKFVKELQSKRTVELITAHYHPNDIYRTHQYWKDELGLPIAGLAPALDVTEFCGSNSMPEFECDIIHISGYWPFKAQVIDKYFLPLLNTNLKIKIFGNKPWPSPSYCGYIDDKYVKHAFKSAKLNLNLSEPHAMIDDAVEVNEKNFKLLGGKNVVLSTADGSLMRNFFKNGEILFSSSPKDFFEKSQAIVAGELSVDPLPGYNLVMGGETYFHRVSSLLSNLGLEEESKHVLTQYAELRRVNSI